MSEHGPLTAKRYQVLDTNQGASETCLIEADSRCCTRFRFGLTWADIFAANGQQLKHKFPSSTKRPFSPMLRIVITGLSTTVIRSDPCLLRHRKLWNTHRAVGYGILADMESESRSRSSQALKNESIQGQCAHLGGPHQVNSMLTRTNQRTFYTFVRIDLSHIPPRTTQRRRIC